MLIHAPAKINWSLDITGQRADGYHLMDMLMQPVSLYDDVFLEEAPELELTCSGTPLLPADESHLALRAARALAQAAGRDAAVRIHVHKRIPVQAGMGGGSADAAAVLHGLNRLWELRYSQDRLEEIGLTLGADVPFCLRGGLQRVTGIGEIIRPCAGCPSFPLVVIQPCGGLSTGAVFRAYHSQTEIRHPDSDGVQHALEAADLNALAQSIGNVLQPVSEKMQPEIGAAIRALKEAGAAIALMTGSGSAVFGIFREEKEAASAQALLKQRWERCWCCHSLE